MLIPVRCFSCNAVIGHKWNTFEGLVKKYIDDGSTQMDANNKALDDIGFPAETYCCRRMFLGHVNIIDKLLIYSNNPGEKISYFDKYAKDNVDNNEEEEVEVDVEDADEEEVDVEDADEEVEVDIDDVDEEAEVDIDDEEEVDVEDADEEVEVDIEDVDEDADEEDVADEVDVEDNDED